MRLRSVVINVLVAMALAVIVLVGLTYLLLCAGTELPAGDEGGSFGRLLDRSRRIFVRKIFWGRISYRSLNYPGGFRLRIDGLRWQDHDYPPMIFEPDFESLQVQGHFDARPRLQSYLSEHLSFLSLTTSVQLPTVLQMSLLGVASRRIGSNWSLTLDPVGQSFRLFHQATLECRSLKIHGGSIRIRGGDLNIRDVQAGWQSSQVRLVGLVENFSEKPFFKEGKLEGTVDTRSLLGPENPHVTTGDRPLVFEFEALGRSASPRIQGTIEGDLVIPRFHLPTDDAGSEKSWFSAKLTNLKGKVEPIPLGSGTVNSAHLSSDQVLAEWAHVGKNLRLEGRLWSQETRIFGDLRSPIFEHDVLVQAGALKLLSDPSPAGDEAKVDPVQIAVFPYKALQVTVEQQPHGSNLEISARDFLGGQVAFKSSPDPEHGQADRVLDVDRMDLGLLSQHILGPEFFASGSASVRLMSVGGSDESTASTREGFANDCIVSWESPTEDGGALALADICRRLKFPRVEILPLQFGDEVLITMTGKVGGSGIQAAVSIDESFRVTAFAQFDLEPSLFEGSPAAQQVFRRLGTSSHFVVIGEGLLGKVRPSIAGRPPASLVTAIRSLIESR